jgi:hypothetical protein
MLLSDIELMPEDDRPQPGTLDYAAHEAEQARWVAGLLAAGRWCHACRDSLTRCIHGPAGGRTVAPIAVEIFHMLLESQPTPVVVTNNKILDVEK